MAVLVLRSAARPHAAAVAFAGLVLAALAGLTFPDLDQVLPLLHHRSALTHGMLPAIACLAWRWLRPTAAGLALGIGLHLAADCFPEAMRGYATVKLPLGGSIGAGWSYAWLAGNAAAGGALFGLLLDDALPDRRWRIAALAGVVPFGLVYLWGVPGGPSAILVLAAIGWAGWRVGRPRGARH